jgi:hypothetical protein
VQLPQPSLSEAGRPGLQGALATEDRDGAAEAEAELIAGFGSVRPMTRRLRRRHCNDAGHLRCARDGEPDSAALLDAADRGMIGPPRPRPPHVRSSSRIHLKPGHAKIARCSRMTRASHRSANDPFRPVPAKVIDDRSAHRARSPIGVAVTAARPATPAAVRKPPGARRAGLHSACEAKGAGPDFHGRRGQAHAVSRGALSEAPPEPCTQARSESADAVGNARPHEPIVGRACSRPAAAYPAAQHGRGHVRRRPGREQRGNHARFEQRGPALVCSLVRNFTCENGLACSPARRVCIPGGRVRIAGAIAMLLW